MTILTNIDSKILIGFEETEFDPVLKEGFREGISTSVLEDIWPPGGIKDWQISAVGMEILSNNLNDTLLGTGARSVLIEGLDTSFVEQSEVVNMNGTTPVVLANTYTRINTMIVIACGTYATTLVGSNTGVITLQLTGGGSIQAQIPVLNNIGIGITSGLHYTVPSGKQALILDIFNNVNDNSPADIFPFVRSMADVVVAPFSPKISSSFIGAIQGLEPIKFEIGSLLDEKTDLWFSGIAESPGADVKVGVELLLRIKP